MAAERQGRALDATGQPSPLKMPMELAQSVDVDHAVIHPDTLNQAGHSGRPLDAKEGVVDQIEYIAHFPKVPSLLQADDRHAVPRVRMVGNGIHPVRGGLEGARERL